MEQSQKWSLSSYDWKKIGKNALIFFAPAFVVFLTAIQQGVCWQEAMLAVYTWLLSVGIDFFKKLSAEK